MRKHDLMYKLYGMDGGHLCKECCNFLFIQPTQRRHSKCEVYGVSCCESTDWNGKKTACGRFNIPLAEGEWTVVEERKHRSRKQPELQCEGQISIFEENG